MKVFCISPCLSYAGGACIIVAESEESAWDIALREVPDFGFYGVEDFSIQELPLSGEKVGVVFQSIYIE